MTQKVTLVACSIATLALMLFGAPAYSQDIDAAAQVQNLLNCYGPVPYTHQIPHTHNETHCVPVHCHLTGDACPDPICGTRQVTTYTSQTDRNVLTASNIQIISGTPVIFDPLTQTSLPDQLTVDGAISYGCSQVTTGTQTQLSIRADSDQVVS
jgi:hypothetical protein